MSVLRESMHIKRIYATKKMKVEDFRVSDNRGSDTAKTMMDDDAEKYFYSQISFRHNM